MTKKVSTKTQMRKYRETIRMLNNHIRGLEVKIDSLSTRSAVLQATVDSFKQYNPTPFVIACEKVTETMAQIIASVLARESRIIK